MKRYRLPCMLIAVILTSAMLSGAFASGLTSSLDAYEPKKIESVDVAPLEDISVGLGEYETHEIESVDVAPIEDISVGLGGYETHEIESVDVAPIEDINISLGEYETHEIENIEVAPIEDINISLGEYETHEIENIEVAPIEDINISLGEYETHEIKNVEVAPLEDLYVDLEAYVGRTLTGVSGAELTELVHTQYDLVCDLNTAFIDAGLNVNLDPISGNVPIASTLLYATNEYKVTEKGKEVLKALMGVYCSVLSQEKYRDAIDRITIVGHTDTDGSYEYNQKLSENRAEAVREFCLSEECGVEDIDWLSERLVAEGHSYDELIYNSDGTENKAASRRVEIGFTIRG